MEMLFSGCEILEKYDRKNCFLVFWDYNFHLYGVVTHEALDIVEDQQGLTHGPLLFLPERMQDHGPLQQGLLVEKARMQTCSQTRHPILPCAV